MAEYLVDLNATQAAIRAGYSDKTAGAVAHKLLKKADIFAAIEQRRGKIANRLEITAERVLLEYARIGLSDMRRFIAVDGGGVTMKPSSEWTDDDAAAVAEVTETTSESGGSVKFKLHNKIAALDALAKHLGLLVNRHEITTPQAITTNEAIEKIEAAIAKVEAKRKG